MREIFCSRESEVPRCVACQPGVRKQIVKTRTFTSQERSEVRAKTWWQLRDLGLSSARRHVEMCKTIAKTGGLRCPRGRVGLIR